MPRFHPSIAIGLEKFSKYTVRIYIKIKINRNHRPLPKKIPFNTTLVPTKLCLKDKRIRIHQISIEISPLLAITRMLSQAGITLASIFVIS